MLATFAYDNLGRRSSLTFGNGTSQDYSFDPVSRLASLTANLAGTANDLTIGTVAYNPASQILSAGRSNDAYSWTGSVAVNRNYTSNGLNQYGSAGPASFTYDARGNLTADGSVTFAYSSQNQLTSASGALSATLGYDPAMRLYQVVGGPTTSRFAYDGLAMIAEYDGANALQRRYVHGPGTDEALVQYEGSGTATRRFLHADERGSIVAVSDDSGNRFAANSYDEYGIPGSGNIGRFQYTGQAWLPELGLQYSKNRIYSPTLGRFLQADPIGVRGGINIYAYVANDPTNWVDPLGLETWGPDGSVTAPSCGGNGVLVLPEGREDSVGWYCGSFDLTEYLLTPVFRRGDAITGSVRSILDEVAESITNAICALPPVDVGFGADAYLGVGGSIDFGLSFDPGSNQLDLNVYGGLGVGLLGDIGPSVGASEGSGGNSVNLATRVGVMPGGGISGSWTHNWLGDDAGVDSASVGKAGIGFGYANAGANLSANLVDLPDC